MRVYDGGYVNGTIVAAITGDTVPAPFVSSAPELLLYFRSDYAVKYTGIVATYMIAPCPFNCSGPGNGACVSGACACVPERTGIGCEHERCPSNCSGVGVCTGVPLACVCPPSTKGPACEVPVATPVWRRDVLPAAPRPLDAARGVYDPVSDTVRSWARWRR